MTIDEFRHAVRCLFRDAERMGLDRSMIRNIVTEEITEGWTGELDGVFGNEISPSYKWICKNCGTLSNDRTCDCTKFGREGRFAPMNTPRDMAAFGANERACYDYPQDTDLASAQRAAFCAGAGWAADKIERLRAVLKDVRAFIAGMVQPAAAGVFQISSYHPCHALLDKIDAALGSNDEQKADGK